MAINSSPRRRPQVESLEQKQMLAGDVVVSVVGGNLVVRGDELDNQIAIHSGPEPGEYVVRGLGDTNVALADDSDDDPAGAAPDAAVVVAGVTRGARIRMGDGDDLVVVNSARFAGGVDIATGAGNDTVIVGTPIPDPPGPPPADGDNAAQTTDLPDGPPRGTGFGRSLRIRTGAGEDTVRVADADVRGHLSVQTGQENDTVHLGLRNLPEPPADGAEVAEETTGENDNQGDNDGGEGRHPHAGLRVAGRLRVGLGGGEDELAMHHVIARGIWGNGGQGDDSLSVAHTRSRTLMINGGAGEGTDTVNLHRIHASSAGIHTHGGVDQVAITDSAFGRLLAHLGAGDDKLSMGRVKARFAGLHGGPGDADLLERLGENMIRHRRVSGFELPGNDAGADDEGIEEI